MAKAAQDAGLTIDGTVKSMMDLQQKGGLISSKVLPHFAKRMSEAAKANGGLENAMKSNRVAMNQMVTAAQMAADTIFKSGWSEGLTDLFKATGDMLMENEALLISFGKVAGKVFKGLAWLIKNVVSPVFSALGSIMNGLIEIFGETGLILGGVGFALWKVVKAVKVATSALTMMGAATNLAFLPIIGTLAAIASGLLVLEELAEFISPTGKKSVLREVLGLDSEKDKGTDMSKNNLKTSGAVGFGGLGLQRVGQHLAGKLQDYLPSFGPSSESIIKSRNSNQQNSYVTVEIPVNINGEEVGRAIAPSEAIRSAIAAGNYSSNY